MKKNFFPPSVMNVFCTFICREESVHFTTSQHNNSIFSSIHFTSTLHSSSTNSCIHYYVILLFSSSHFSLCCVLYYFLSYCSSEMLCFVSTFHRRELRMAKSKADENCKHEKRVEFKEKNLVVSK